MTLLDDRMVRDLRALVSEPGPGDVLGDRFELGEAIGEGGMGIVYAALDRTTSREVAVKIVRASGADAEERFVREANALATVVDPAVVSYIERGAHEGVHWVAMDRLVGCTLATRLARSTLTVSETLALGHTVATGLAAVHRAGITHRDLKPANVFLVDEVPARARIVDFGLARPLARPPLTATGALVGTPGYMSPEQARGERAGPPADVFALGCVLFECLTGRVAFDGATTETLLARILLEAPPLVRSLCSAAPLALEALVEQMLEKEPKRRPDAEEVARELRALEAYVPTEAAGTSIEPAPGLAEGTVIADKYRIERRIGEGGMGIVVAARHLELGKRVALKLLRGGQAADEARFLREAQAASRLESEHVARVLDVGRTSEGAPYIVMEYLNGVDLARHLVEHGPLPVARAVGYVLEACEAIAEAHALGIVHRDIKPSNLFLVSRRDGTELVKVLDFGISKVTRSLEGASGAASMTGASAVIGSAWYMSPEQLQSSKNVDARTDVWALGVVLHELVSGTRPFDGESAAAVGARIATAPPTPLRKAAKDAPAELEAVIARCLEKNLDARIAGLGELAEALAPFAEDRAASVERITRTLGVSRRSGRAIAAAEAPETVEAVPAPSSAPRRVFLGVALASAVAAVVIAIVSRGNETAKPEAVVPITVSAPPAASAPPVAAAQTATPSEASSMPTVERPTPKPPTLPSSKVAVSARPPTTPAPLSSSSRPSGRDLDLRDPALEGR